LEWLREEWERTVGELARRRTHSEGLFPFIRILSNVVVRELQTMAILLDIYLGVPVIYSTYMQYDELGHHFGPASWQALRDLRRTDSRIRSIRRMIRSAAGRDYDLVILSDHGMAPSASYRVLYGEPLGSTIQRILDGDAARRGRVSLSTHTSESPTSEYGGVAPSLFETLAEQTPPRRRALRRGLRLLGTLDGDAVSVESAKGHARIRDGVLRDTNGDNPLEPYGTEPLLARAVERLVRQTNAGDLVLFGAYDGYEIVCFDDQVGAHGS